MITEIAKLLNRAAVSVRPEDILLKKGSWVNFSPSWPHDSVSEWATGKSFEVSTDPVLLKFPASYILANGDYCYIDISNQIPPGTVGAAASLQMYPAQTGVLYQIAVGLKKGKYFVQLQIPKGLYVYTPGSSSVFPDITDSTKRYIGAKYPDDSPDSGPLWMLYAIYNQPAFILVPFVDGVDYEKVTFEMYINKCPLKAANLTTEQQRSALQIQWYKDLQGF